MARGILVYTVVAGVAGAAAADLGFMAGILAGGVFTYLNLVWLSSIVKGFLTGVADPKRFAAGLVLKTLGAYSAVGLLVYLELVQAMPFIIGLSSLVVSVFIVGLRWHRTLGSNRIR
jgi:hypothetical protein